MPCNDSPAHWKPVHLTCDSGAKCWQAGYHNCLWQFCDIIRSHCCLRNSQENLTEQLRLHCHFIFSHNKNTIIYIIDWFSVVLMFVYLREIWVTSLSLSVSCRRGVTSSFTAAAVGKFVNFVPVEQRKNWGPPLLNSTHLCSTHSSLSSRRRCLTTPGQRNVCARVSSDAWLCLTVSVLK